jgi:lysophospholipase-2
VLGGFSQGAAVSLLSLVTSSHQFAGVVGLSGYVPLLNKLDELRNAANAKTPVFMGHGNADQGMSYKSKGFSYFERISMHKSVLFANRTNLGGVLSCYFLILVVQYAWGKKSSEALKGKGYSVTFNTYQGLGHSASNEEMQDLLNFLQKVVP